MNFTRNDKVKSVKLHEANRILSHSFFGSLQTVEIVLRNSMHSVLKVGLKQDNWYDIECFDEAERRQINKAKDYVTKELKTITPPRVVAAMSFGLWVGLMRAHYARPLWNPCLNKAFPANPSLKHKDAHERFTHLLTIRNRIAHHEPLVFRYRNLANDLAKLVEAVGWINTDASQWVDTTGRQEMLAAYKEAIALAGPLPK